MMEFASQFVEGLDGPASMTFIGLLFAAFLIGLLPAGLTYAFRVRDVQKRLRRHVDAHQRVTQERNVLEGKVERLESRDAEHVNRLRNAGNDLASLENELAGVREQLTGAQADALAARAELTRGEEYVSGLRGKVATLSAQVQSLRNNARPRASTPQPFDMETLANLKTARTKVAALEQRVTQLTQDNERMRRELATG